MKHMIENMMKEQIEIIIEQCRKIKINVISSNFLIKRSRIHDK